MRQLTRLFLLTGLAGSLVACQEADFKKTASGIPYKVIEGKGNEKIAQGDFVKLQVVQRIKDSVLFSTHTTLPQYLQVGPAAAGYDIQNSLMEVLPNVQVGDSLQFVQAMDSFIKQNPQLSKETPFRNGDQLITGIRVVDVFKSQADYQADMQKEGNALFDRDPRVQEQLRKDDQAIRQYLQENKIEAQKTGKGTYVQVLEPGSGPKAADGKYVSVLYKGFLFNGKVFDTNMEGGSPYTFQLGSGGAIKGFEEGIRQLSQGGKARVFIPSMLAYGAMQASEDIQPFTNLIFDIQLIGITDNAPAGAAAPHNPNDGSDHSGHNH